MLITYIENMAKRIRHKMVKKLLRMYVKKKEIPYFTGKMLSLITTSKISDLEYITHAHTQFIKALTLVEKLLDSFN